MIFIKTAKEIEIMTRGGKILAEIIKKLEEMAKPGVAAKELNEAAEALILKSGGKCSFKGHQGFPTCLCVSINEEIVHGVPAGKVLKEGDVLSLDLGIFFSVRNFLKKKEINDSILPEFFPNLKEGFHTDMASTVFVSSSGPRALGADSFSEEEKRRLIRVTKKALKRGIKKVRPGNTFGDIGNTIQRYAESQGYNVVRDLCGHGIGKELHEDPKILNYGKRHAGFKIKEGMVFCLEPMLTIGDCHIKQGKDGHSFESVDGSLSAHFEHMVAVTKDGCRILTELR